MILIELDPETKAKLHDCYDPDEHADADEVLLAALEVYDELENPEEMRPDPGGGTPGGELPKPTDNGRA